jgi:hypothetical protein
MENSRYAIATQNGTVDVRTARASKTIWLQVTSIDPFAELSAKEARDLSQHLAALAEEVGADAR